ncbi:MAG: N-acetylmuramoyl-L-alanine amidase [Dysgonomonas sp.]
MKRISIFFVCIFIICGTAFPTNNKFVVVIDAGHGGKDSGAVRGNYKEKTINLGVALALGQLIERNMKDVKVVYTRKTDVFIDLDKRAEIANKAKANLFISIHTNSTAAKNTTASGADTYILGLARSAENLEVAKRENSVILLEDDYSTKYEGFDPNSPESYIIFEFMTNKYMEQSLQFASLVQKDFKNIAKRADRGVRQAGFLVLRKTSTPSVLIELGFINNLTEARYLVSEAGQKQMASAIYSGFLKYKYEFDKMQGKTSMLPNNKNEDIDVAQELPAEDDTQTNIPVTQNNNKTNSKKDINSGQIEYRVQILYSATKLPANSPQFKGLSPVDYYQDGKGYKYTYGSSTDQNEILKTFRKVSSKFKDAFIIKFKDGKRVN